MEASPLLGSVELLQERESSMLRIICAAACALTALVMTAPAKAATQTVLYRFCSQANCNDGADPSGGVAMAPNGALYGVTSYGGSRAGECHLNGCGVVYQLTPGSGGWSQTVLYRFQGDADGANPLGKLLLRPNGSLIGMTPVGGLFEAGRTGGTVFELTPPST